MTNEEFRALGHQLIDWAADYRAGLGALPAGAAFTPGVVKAMLPATPPQHGESLTDLPAELNRLVVPHVIHWQHPRFFGWFPSGGLEAGILGDLIGTALGVVGLSWQSAPALTELEEVTLDWLRQMCGLPACYAGAIQESASVATLVALLVARERASAMSLQRGGLAELATPLTVYGSEHAHSSVEKAALLAGYGSDNLRLAPCRADGAIDPAALRAMIAADIAVGKRPAALVATSGTTSVTAFDPLAALADIAAEFGLWFHVDAAMAGAGLILPELRPLMAGIDRADSLVFNGHKWLGVAFDASFLYVRDPVALEQVMSTNPTYLQSAADGAVRNFRDWGLPLGRRFRALKLWLVLRDQGVEGLQARLRRDLANARWLGEQVAATPGWRLAWPVTLQTVCLRHEPAGLAAAALDAHQRRWAEALNASGKAWVTPAKVGDEWLVRVSIGAHATEHADVVAAWAAIQATATACAPAPDRRALATSD